MWFAVISIAVLLVQMSLARPVCMPPDGTEEYDYR